MEVHKFVFLFLSVIVLASCSNKEEVGHLAMLVEDIKLHHKRVMIEFNKELVLFVKQAEKDKEIRKIISRGNLTDSDKQRVKALVSEGKQQADRMLKASNEAIESTIDIMSLVSAIYRFCDQDEASKKISRHIGVLQNEYGNKMVIEVSYWKSVWARDKEFSRLDPELECGSFRKIQQDVDATIINAINKLSGKNA